MFRVSKETKRNSLLLLNIMTQREEERGIAFVTHTHTLCCLSKRACVGEDDDVNDFVNDDDGRQHHRHHHHRGRCTTTRRLRRRLRR